MNTTKVVEEQKKVEKEEMEDLALQRAQEASNSLFSLTKAKWDRIKSRTKSLTEKELKGMSVFQLNDSGSASKASASSYHKKDLDKKIEHTLQKMHDIEKENIRHENSKHSVVSQKNQEELDYLFKLLDFSPRKPKRLTYNGFWVQKQKMKRKN